MVNKQLSVFTAGLNKFLAVSLLFIMSVGSVPQLFAEDGDENDVPSQTDEVTALLQSMIDDKGEGWMCEWTLYVPDRLQTDTKVRIIPGLRGFSSVSTEDDSFLRINDLMGDYFLRFDVTKENNSINPKLVPWQGITDTDRPKSIYFTDITESNYTKATNINFYLNGTNFLNTIKQGAEFNGIKCESKNNDVLLIELGEIGKNYVLYKNWNGKEVNSATSNANTNEIEEVLKNSLFCSSLILTIYKPAENEFVQAQFEGEVDKSAVTEIKNHFPLKVEMSNKKVLIENLYNKGMGISGSVFDYAHNENYELKSTTPSFDVKGSKILYSNSYLNNLQFTSFPIKLKKIESNSRIVEFDLNLIENTLYYEDYLVLNESDYAIIEKSMPDYNANYKMFRPFYDDYIDNKNYDAVSGDITFGGNGSLNFHWDRDESFADNIHVEFGKHYLVPLRYFYSVSSNLADFDYFFKPYKDGIIKVESLKFDIPAENIDLSNDIVVSLSNVEQSHGEMEWGGEDDVDCIRFSADLNASVDDVFVYVVRGQINDYTADELADAENGHINGVLLTGTEYDVFGSVEEPLSTLAVTNTNSVEYQIPKSDLIGEGDNYTVYAKYTDEDNNARFRVLSELYYNPDDAATGVRDLSEDFESPDFVINGNVLYGNGANVVIFDSAGRHVASCVKGQRIMLNNGFYVVKSGEKAAKVLINR